MLHHSLEPVHSRAHGFQVVVNMYLVFSVIAVADIIYIYINWNLDLKIKIQMKLKMAAAMAAWLALALASFLVVASRCTRAVAGARAS